jgi:hypothetical protein
MPGRMRYHRVLTRGHLAINSEAPSERDVGCLESHSGCLLDLHNSDDQRVTSILFFLITNVWSDGSVSSDAVANGDGHKAWLTSDVNAVCPLLSAPRIRSNTR